MYATLPLRRRYNLKDIKVLECARGLGVLVLGATTALPYSRGCGAGFEATNGRGLNGLFANRSANHARDATATGPPPACLGVILARILLDDLEAYWHGTCMDA